MHKAVAAAGSLVFLVIAPGFVAGLVPRWITGWRIEEPMPYWVGLRVLGAALIISGTAVLLHSFARFVVEGAGTPAPVAAPGKLVVGGLYRHVRNPMYVAVLAIVVGQALLLGQLRLLLYAAVLFACFSAFVRWYEEPNLSRRFGEEYEAYRRAVPAWLPRLRPWKQA